MPTGLEGFFGLPKGYLDKAKPFSLFQTLARAPSKSSSVFQSPQIPSQVMNQPSQMGGMMGQPQMSPPLNNGMPMNAARVPPPFPQPPMMPGQPPQMPPPIMSPGPMGPPNQMQGPPNIPPQILMQLLQRIQGMNIPGGQPPMRGMM